MRTNHHVNAVAMATAMFVCATGVVQAQSEGTVHGQVVAAADRSAVAGAALTLKSAAGVHATHAITDVAGRFAFPAVWSGQYTLVVAANGFQTREVSFVLEPREIRGVTLALEVASLDVRVEVAADASTLISTHSPSSTVLTSERLEAMPVFHRETLPDAVVSLAPGMIRGHDDFVHIRGHEIALNPVINGVSFWENTHAVFSPGLSAEIIETANVMTGGFPAEYGNRFGGVIDVVTKSGLRMDHRGSATLSAGNSGRRRAAGEIGGSRRGLGYYAFGSLSETDRFFSPPDREALHDAAGVAHLFTTLDGTLGSGRAWRAMLAGDGVNAEIPVTAQDLALRPAARASQRSRQQTAMFGWSRATSDLMIGASGYQRWSRLRLPPVAGPLTARAELARELLTIGTKADVTRVAGRHALKAGVDAVRLAPEEALAYEYSGYRDLTHLLDLPHIHVLSPSITFSGRKTGSQVSAFVQDNVRVGSRVTADLGVRVDRYNLVVSEAHVSPRVNIAMDAGPRAALHASYNRFFVPPAIEGVLSSSAGLTQQISEIGTPLPALAGTIEDQVETGISSSVAGVQMAATAYYRRTDNPVHTTIWPDSRIYSYASFDRARAYGLEVRADARGWTRYGATAYFNYAWGRVHFYNPVTGGFITEAAHITGTNRFLAPMDQTHTLTGGATYRHGASGAWMSAGIEYGSGTPIGHGGAHEHADGEADHVDATARTGDTRIHGHLTGNVTLGFDLLRHSGNRSRLTLRVDVENVANDPYVIARASEFSPAQYSNPRLISVTARVRF
jgi:hypothetical protein